VAGRLISENLPARGSGIRRSGRWSRRSTAWSNARCVGPPQTTRWSASKSAFGAYDLLAKLLVLNELPCVARRNSAAERL
jgi:hypothetical protein